MTDCMNWEAFTVGGQRGATLDTKRKSILHHCGPLDLAANVERVEPIPGFDLSKTIFQTITSPVTIKFIEFKIGYEPVFRKEYEEEMDAAYTLIPRPLDIRKPLYDFMRNECDFAVEHADGSFMDHLRFCYEYGVQSMKQHSPLPLFLHSIMGVATNLFPMGVEKIERLKEFCETEANFEQIQSFPSILRLGYTRTFLDELLAMDKAKLNKITGVKFHLVINNDECKLDTADKFWLALNYQIIHQLDFLPFGNWRSRGSDSFFLYFVDLLTVLRRAGKLMADINFDVTCRMNETEVAEPFSLARMVVSALPFGAMERIQCMLTARQIRQNSAAINHSLEYEILF